MPSLLVRAPAGFAWSWIFCLRNSALPEVVVAFLFVAPPGMLSLLRPADPAAAPAVIAVDPVIHQCVRRIEQPLYRPAAVAFLAARDVALGKFQVIEDGLSVGPLPEEMVVAKEVVMTEGGMGHHQGLHGHGVVLHDVADAGNRIDDDLIGQPAGALARS